MPEVKNNIIRNVFILFCLFQILFDGFLVLSYFNRINTYDKILSDFVKQGNLQNQKFSVLVSFHNRLIESSFVGNEKLESTVANFVKTMHNQSSQEFNDCVAKYKDPILIEEPEIRIESPRVSGYIVHLYDKTTFDEIGFTIFDEDFVFYNIFACGQALYNETTKTLEFELV